MQLRESYINRRNEFINALESADSTVLKSELIKSIILTDLCVEIYSDLYNASDFAIEMIGKEISDMKEDMNSLATDTSLPQSMDEVENLESDRRGVEDNYTLEVYRGEGLFRTNSLQKPNSETLDKRQNIIEILELSREINSLRKESDNVINEVDESMKEARSKVESFLSIIYKFKKSQVVENLEESLTCLDEGVFVTRNRKHLIKNITRIVDFLIGLTPVGPFWAAFDAIKSSYRSRIKEVKTADDFLGFIETYNYSAIHWCRTSQLLISIYKQNYQTQIDLSESYLYEEAIIKVNERFTRHVDRVINIIKKDKSQSDA